MSAPEKHSLLSPAELEGIAATWLARIDVGVSAAEEREFQAWLRADPRHTAAWREVESAWLVFDQPRRNGTADTMIAELSARSSRRQRRLKTSIVGVLAAACVAIVFFPRSGSPRLTTSTAVRIVVKPERQTLSDGSIVVLNNGAEISVEFSENRRGVRLLSGEAHFHVVKNPARPFVVSAGGIDVRAVGTAFAVKLEPRSVNVLVTEGRVGFVRLPFVSTATTAQGNAVRMDPVFAEKGDRVSMPVAPDERPQVQSVPVSELEQLLAWRGPRLELAGTSIADAVAALSHENNLRITIADPELGAMRMSGVFRADNAEGFVQLLESHFGVLVQRRGNEIVLSKAR